MHGLELVGLRGEVREVGAHRGGLQHLDVLTGGVGEDLVDLIGLLAVGRQVTGPLGEGGEERLGELAAANVGAVALAEDGTTYFTAKRTGEDGESSDDAQLWTLPTRGEAEAS